MAKNQITVSEMARRGADAVNANRTPEERSEAARKAVNARWEKWRRENKK